jgi:hypothetical protein
MAVSRDIKRARRAIQRPADAVLQLLSRPSGAPLWRRILWKLSPAKKRRDFDRMAARAYEIAKKRRGKLARAHLQSLPIWQETMRRDRKETMGDLAKMRREARVL